VTKYLGPKTDPANVSTQGDKPDLATTAPTSVTTGATGAAGSATTAARADHTHALGSGLVEFLVPTGAVMAWPTLSAPSGWLICSGQAVSRSTYSGLFAVISVQYGTGDGSTTFNLPNLKGKVPVGYDVDQDEFDAINEQGGSKTHTLTSSEMPAHAHTTRATQINTNTATGGSNALTTLRSSTGGNEGNTANTGGGGAHNNLQPYIVLTYIIKI
jgi:microcystin-dependent protein